MPILASKWHCKFFFSTRQICNWKCCFTNKTNNKQFQQANKLAKILLKFSEPNMSFNFVTEAHTICPHTIFLYFYFYFCNWFQNTIRVFIHAFMHMRPDLNLISYNFLWLWKFFVAVSVRRNVFIFSPLCLHPVVLSLVGYSNIFSACDGTNNNCACIHNTYAFVLCTSIWRKQ